MSQLNGLGPNNQDPMTGRGLGKCNGGVGRCGIGFSNGYGRRFLTRKETKEELEGYKIQLEAEIAAINEELGLNK